MRVVADSHTIVWYIAGSRRLFRHRSLSSVKRKPPAASIHSDPLLLAMVMGSAELWRLQ